MQAMLMRLAVVLVMSFGALANESNILACQADFAGKRISCASLYDFSLCLSNATETASESASAAAAAVLAAAYTNYDQDCSDYVPEGTEASVEARNGSLTFQVDSDKDVSFLRFRRQTISLFDLVDKVASLETAVTEAHGELSELRVATSTISTGTQAAIGTAATSAITAAVNLAKANDDAQMMLYESKLNASAYMTQATVFPEMLRLSEMLQGQMDARHNGTAANVLRDAYTYTDDKVEQVEEDLRALLSVVNTTLQQIGSGGKPSDYMRCSEVFAAGLSAGDGMYTLKSGDLYCDMTNGGWTRLYSNPLTSNHDGIDFQEACPCSNELGKHSSAGWRLGVSNCEDSNPLTDHIGAKSADYTWRMNFDAIPDVGSVSRVKHVGKHPVDLGYDHTNWAAAEPVTTNPLEHNGEAASAYLTPSGWQWLARYSIGSFAVESPQAVLVHPYFTFLYSDGGPPDCSISNSDGFQATDYEVWVF